MPFSSVNSFDERLGAILQIRVEEDSSGGRSMLC